MLYVLTVFTVLARIFLPAFTLVRINTINTSPSVLAWWWFAVIDI